LALVKQLRLFYPFNEESSDSVAPAGKF